MHPVCRRASDNLYIRVEQTALLYKEGPELPHTPCCQEPAASSTEFFCLGLDATTRNLPAGDEVSA